MSDAAVSAIDCGRDTTTTTLPFPKHGVRLSYLDQFIEACGGESELSGLTTTEVCLKYVVPLTKEMEVSLCDYLIHQASPVVGLAETFISHAWKYEFLEVVKALKLFFSNNSVDGHSSENKRVYGADPVIWFDIFSNNQHKAVELDFHWWATTFRTAIAQFGHTVMVFAPWNDPVPLQRGWCVWELYCTISTKSLFSIAMSPAQEQGFVNDIIASNASKTIQKMLASVNCERSECFKLSDKEKIFEAVRQTVGFAALNKLIFSELQGWIINRIQKEWEQRVASLGTGHNDTLGTQYTLAALLNFQGKQQEAEQMMRLCYDSCAEHHGPENIATLVAQGSLCTFLAQLGKFDESRTLSEALFSTFDVLISKQQEPNAKLDSIYWNELSNFAIRYCQEAKFKEALALFQKCYDHCRSLEESGTQQQEEMWSIMQHMGLVYKELANYELAAIFLQQCYEGRRKLYGENHPLTLKIQVSMANVYLAVKKFDEAKQIYADVSSVYRTYHGDNHPDTLLAVDNLANSMRLQGDLPGARVLYEDVYHRRNALYGAHHPDTLHSHYNVAACLNAMQQHEEAMVMFRDIHTRMNVVLGEKHSFTLHCLYTIANALLRSNKVVEAVPVYEDVIAKYTTVFGELHPAVKQAVSEYKGATFAVQVQQMRAELFPAVLEVGVCESHKEHRLECCASVYDGAGYGCDVCHASGQGMVYHCTDCGFDAHPQCALSSLEFMHLWVQEASKSSE